MFRVNSRPRDGKEKGKKGHGVMKRSFVLQHLVEQYQHEASLERKLLESVEIHVIANLNPDGYSRAIPGSCYSKDGRYESDIIVPVFFSFPFNLVCLLGKRSHGCQKYI